MTNNHNNETQEASSNNSRSCDYLSAMRHRYNARKIDDDSSGSSLSQEEHVQRYEKTMASLRAWVWECQQWSQYHATYFQHRPERREVSLVNNQQNVNGLNDVHAPTNGAQNFAAQDDNQPNARPHLYRIAPLWKRIVADCIDFGIILIIKIVVLWLFFSGFVEYDDNSVLMRNIRRIYSDLQNDNYRSLFEDVLTYEEEGELIIVAIFHRLIGIVYETFSLWFRNPQYPYGGATFGKMVMGLAVLSFHSVDVLNIGPTAPGNRTPGVIRIHPGGNIGFLNSLLRAVIKNSSIFFLIPSCFTLLAFPFNRMAYDMICSSVVVEVVH